MIPLAVSLAALAAPDASRQQQLVHLVREDCGSCHGLTLKGGLGPALTTQALRGRDADSIAAIIRFGRPGTPMPPFRGILSDPDIDWVTAKLLLGFPEDK